jgi:hypothetical protein
MTCIRFAGGIICVNPWGRLHIGNRYIWVDFHEYCGPTFFTDRYMNTIYEPADENDPVWDAFYDWHKKYEAKKKIRDKQRASQAASHDTKGSRDE